MLILILSNIFIGLIIFYMEKRILKKMDAKINKLMNDYCYKFDYLHSPTEEHIKTQVHIEEGKRKNEELRKELDELMKKSKK